MDGLISQKSEERVLIVAPSGRDAINLADVLSTDGIAFSICPDVQAFADAARHGCGAVVITQEGLTERTLAALQSIIRSQSPWSDIPIILLASGADATGLGSVSLRSLGLTTALTVLERPLRVVSLLSAIKAALRARRRQYEVRDLLAQRDYIAGQLQERARNLEVSQQELLTAKEKISRHAEDLERTVAERTAKLRETIAQLEAFSYSISHDMRGPLRAMQQYAQILMEDCRPQLSSDACEYLERISRASNRLDRLIQDVLTYSRLSRGTIPLVPVDLDKLVHDILQQYPSFQPPRANIEIPRELPSVLGNEAALTQCISNLLSNAVKFVPSGRQPRVKVYPGEENGRVQIYFEDNGIGIARENHQRIFNIFERINSDTEYEGTGIGLSIVKKTIERMGGDLGLESAVGQGSKFWIRLPAVKT